GGVITSGPAKVIQAGSAKVIRLRPAKVIRVRRPSTRSRVALEWSWGAARRGSGICGLLRTTRKEQSDMSAQRISMHRVQEMIRLHRAGGLTTHRIAKMLKMSPNTEREYRQALQRAELLDGAVDELPGLEELRVALAGQFQPAVTPPQQ